jgi:hypothetical protein
MRQPRRELGLGRHQRSSQRGKCTAACAIRHGLILLRVVLPDDSVVLAVISFVDATD